jgi:hypothetical protein
MVRNRWIVISGVLVLAAASSATMRAYDNPGKLPQAIHLREVTPPEGKAGDILTGYGDNLNASRVKELWLTDGKTDYQVEILEQAGHTILFRLPDGVPVGRWRLMLKSDEDLLLEQPAHVKVRESRGPTSG